MISVVMPYWQRPDVLIQNLDRYAELYRNQDIEIIVVDDGSHDIPNDVTGAIPIDIVVMEKKYQALNPCLAYNVGVEESVGEYVVLTNPEIVHRSAILAEMEKQTAKSDSAYVAAACYGGGWWQCHSKLMPPDAKTGRAPSPKGAGLHFCAMLKRKLYDQIGGFHEEYREGQGYEDNDLLWKLDAAGAKFVIRDDLITDHQFAPRSVWPEGGAMRNKAIFERRWPNATAG